MKGDAMTRSRLQAELWWWTHQGKLDLLREAADGNGLEIGPGARLERAAFGYEMAKRGSSEHRDLPTYWELRQQGADVLLLGYIEPSHVSAFRHVWGLGPGDHADKRWQSLDPDLQWNLTFSDQQLAKAFIGQINALRERHQVSKAARSKGFKNRGLAWHRLEVLDLDRYKVEPLDDTDRSDLSKAKRQADEWASIYEPLLNQLRGQDPAALLAESS